MNEPKHAKSKEKRGSRPRFVYVTGGEGGILHQAHELIIYQQLTRYHKVVFVPLICTNLQQRFRCSDLRHRRSAINPSL